MSTTVWLDRNSNIHRMQVVSTKKGEYAFMVLWEYTIIFQRKEFCEVQLGKYGIFQNQVENIFNFLCVIYEYYQPFLQGYMFAKISTRGSNICPLLMIAHYHQTKTPISFWCRRELNPRSLIQPSETLPVELTGTHVLFETLFLSLHGIIYLLKN